MNDKIYTLDEVERISNEFQNLLDSKKPYWNMQYPINFLSAVKILRVLGLNWGDQYKYNDFRIKQGYYVTNNGTGHKPDKDTWYIEWDNGNVGAYQFCDDESYPYVQEDYREFKERLMSYGPVNYDPLNNHIIFEVENGKKLLADYDLICKETRVKMRKKLQEIEIERTKKKLENLLKETQE